MMPHWGATAEDWDLFVGLGLTRDLLPVVSNPQASISPLSKMKSVGKTPSRYNTQGCTVGIPDWTQLNTTAKGVAKWREQTDYGICIQTRRVRALDIDVEDETQAHLLDEAIADALGFYLPRRFRADSGKFLIAFNMEGEFPKRYLEVKGGMVEFLGNGQQFVAVGTHPKGEKYEWNWGDFFDFPTLEESTFEALWQLLVTKFGISDPVTGRGPRKRGDWIDVNDPVVAELDVLGEGKDGQVYIDCPWKEGHSADTGIAQTCYFPKGTNGYEVGHFKCLHAHCAKRTDDEFLDALDLRQGMFCDEILTPLSNGEAALEGLGTVVVAEPLPPLQRDAKGKALATMVNVLSILRRPDIICCRLAWDNFQGLPLYAGEGDPWRLFKDADYTRLRERFDCLPGGFASVGREMIRDACHLIFDHNQIDTAQKWLAGVPAWDGVNRMGRFLADYLGAEDCAYTTAVSRYLWTALAGRILHPGVKADMAVILSGPQGTGKSGIAKLLAPFDDAFSIVNFGESEDAIARKLRGVCVAELGELKGLQNRDIETVKSLVSTTHDKWVPKYIEHTTTYPRRAIFIGTTNDEEFLSDPTGNRRWLPVIVGRIATMATKEEKIQGTHAFVEFKKWKQQFYAEAKAKYLVEGVAAVEAEKLGREVHARHMVGDSWSDLVRDWLGREGLDDLRPADAEYIRMSDALRGAVNMAPERVEKRHEMRMAAVLTGLGYKKKVRPVDGKPQKIWITVENTRH